MLTNTFIVLALSVAGIVSAHGKVSVVTGNAGGNGTALGIKGASVARFGKNSITESDTTVFGGNAKKPLTDGLGKTTADGSLSTDMLSEAMALSGSILPQVSMSNGSLTGTWQTVTSDGTANNADGELFAVLDTTGTGAYSEGTQLVANTAMVGNGNGNVVQRALTMTGIKKRATNVGADAKFVVEVPAGTNCTGTDATTGLTGICYMKIVNNNNAGPFGGNVAFQMAVASNMTASNMTAMAKQGQRFRA
ncbi:hypothetical protein BJ878DRAFT_505866 [Calycina marina]|uniref:GEgh 16 protein n=1 Tax=Calycina marina TaxID=1763456 RepID=A0A9P7Z432_9HELO|nr:hypothetical protein BJ878DRAFT_505866 [Calycina marina]